jgi:hypothetical protein
MARKKEEGRRKKEEGERARGGEYLLSLMTNDFRLAQSVNYRVEVES